MTGHSWLDALFGPAHVSEWISGLWGALGAMAGSLITLAWTERFNRRAREEDLKERFGAVAFSTYQRLNHIYSLTCTIRQHFQEGYNRGKKSGGPICLATQPMQRLSPPVFMPIDDLWVLTKIGGAAIINKINNLDYAFNMLQDSVDVYTSMRRDLMDKLPPPATMQGVQGQVDLTNPDVRALLPTFVELDLLIEQCLPIADRIIASSFDSLVALVASHTYPLGKDFEAMLPNPKGRVVKLRAGYSGPIAMPDEPKI